MKQGIVGVVIGLILGGLIMWFVLQPKYEIVSAENPGIAWVLNQKTGELFMGSVLHPDKWIVFGKPPKSSPTSIYARIATEEEAAKFKPLQ